MKGVRKEGSFANEDKWNFTGSATKVKTKPCAKPLSKKRELKSKKISKNQKKTLFEAESSAELLCKASSCFVTCVNSTGAATGAGAARGTGRAGAAGAAATGAGAAAVGKERKKIKV